MHKVASALFVANLFAVAMPGSPGRRPEWPRSGSGGLERLKISVSGFPRSVKNFGRGPIEILDGQPAIKNSGIHQEKSKCKFFQANADTMVWLDTSDDSA